MNIETNTDTIQQSHLKKKDTKYIKYRYMYCIYGTHSKLNIDGFP